jgi:hypothetical protein
MARIVVTPAADADIDVIQNDLAKSATAKLISD